MPWISRPGGLTRAEMENNANIVINTYRQLGYSDKTIAALLGNMQNESSVNPERQEVGGEGYGLVQWTPVSVLQNHCKTLGLSPYNDGDIQLKVISAEITGNPSSVNEWYTTQAFIDPFKPSGATDDMVGITGNQFIKNEMNWNPDKLAILFMVAYERPSYDPNVNHVESRKKDSLLWYQYMGGVIPPTPTTKGNAIIHLWLTKALTGGI